MYLSLGSLGSADVELMQRLVDLLAEGGYRAIVSKGPQHEQIELRENQVGAELLPQPALLPRVDAVITHGGNNTVTECLHFGKPMVLLPLFWDQYDNAQRMDELGLGARLRTFEFEDSELSGGDRRPAGRRQTRSGGSPGDLVRPPGGAGHREGRGLRRERLAPRAARTHAGLKARPLGPITRATCTRRTVSSGT